MTVACLLVLYDFDYPPADPEIKPIPYELIATRYENKATIVTSTKSLARGSPDAASSTTRGGRS